MHNIKFMHKTMLINFFNTIFAALNLQFMLNLKKILLATMAYLLAMTAMSQVTTGTITGIFANTEKFTINEFMISNSASINLVPFSTPPTQPTQPTVPEPSSLIVLTTGLIALATIKIKKK